MLALDPRSLTAAASRIDAVVASLACLDTASPFRAVGEALAGSATAQACHWVAPGLEAAVDAWADDLAELCEVARVVARDLAATDDSVAGDLGSGTP